MGIHLADQTYSFLGAIVLGGVLGLLYDVFRIVRIAIPAGKVRLFVEDVLYFVVCAAASFLFLLSSSDGMIRVFLLVGELIGTVLFHNTLGILLMRVAQAVIDAVKAILRFCVRWILRPVWRVMYALVTFLTRPIRFVVKVIKNHWKKVKFRLKVGRMVVYNHFKGILTKRIPGQDPAEHSVHDENGQKKEKQKKRIFAPVHLRIRGIRRRDVSGYAGGFGEPKRASRDAGSKG